MYDDIKKTDRSFAVDSPTLSVKAPPVPAAIEQLCKMAHSVRSEAGGLHERLRPVMLLTPEIGAKNDVEASGRAQCDMECAIQEAYDVIWSANQKLREIQKSLQI